MIEVLLISFDLNKGPTVLYTSGDFEEAQKIAFKTQLALTVMNTEINEPTEAILPLITIERVAFCYAFPNNQRVLCILVSIDTEHQLDLYRNIKSLKNRIIETEVFIKVKEPTGEDVKQEFNILKNDLGKVIIQPVIDIEESIDKIDIALQSIPKNLEKVLLELISEGKIVLIGHNINTKLVAESLQQLSPQKVLTISKFSNKQNKLDPKKYDIICTDNPGDFKGLLQINLDKKGKISGGKSNNHLKQIIYEIKAMPKQKKIAYLEKRINTILTNALELIELFEKDEYDKEKVVTFENRFKADELEVIIHLASLSNNIIGQRIKHGIGQRVFDWLEG